MSGTVHDVAGVILAGGLSRRMGGGDKPLLDLAGRPMLAHVIDRLAPQVGALALNANGDPARFAPFDLPVIADPIEGFAGPLAGVLAGLRWAQSNAPQARYMATAAGDTPFFPADFVARTLAAAGDADMIVLARSDGRVHPVFGLWPVAFADDLDAFLTHGESRKVLAWVDRHANTTTEFAPARIGGQSLDPFFNANTPEDLETASGLLAQSS